MHAKKRRRRGGGYKNLKFLLLYAQTKGAEAGNCGFQKNDDHDGG